MKILITGAAGYIGSVCTELMLERGHQVIALDNLSEGHAEAVDPRAVFVQADLHDRERLSGVFRSHPIEAVMHFAASCLVEESVREPGRYYRNNVAAGINLLDAMLRCNVKKFIFSSTAATYGEPETVPISEAHPTRPINPYGASKLFFERVLREFKSNSGLDFVVMRYFNAAGAGAKYGEDHHPETHIIPLLFDAALGKRETFHVFGSDYKTPDGSCVRDYVHVIDIAEAHALALERIGEISGQVYNIGNSHGFSVKQVVECARNVCGCDIPTQIAPRRAGDPATLIAASEKIRCELGWSPRFSDLRSIMESAWLWKQRFPQGYAGKPD